MLRSEPVVYVQSFNAPKMAFVVGSQTISFDERGRGDQDIRVADHLAPLIKIGVYFRRSHNDFIREWQEDIRGAETLERLLPPRRVSGFETPQNLVARDHREREAMVFMEVVSRSPPDLAAR